MPDAYEIGDLAARYLIERGHRRLAFLNLDAGHWPFRLYYQSFAAAATEAHAEVRPVQQQTPASQNDYWHRFSNESVENLVTQFMEMSPRPTGLFVADDMQVALIQPALQLRGIEVGPGKTELISCNNEKPYLVGLAPRPAVIDIRVESIGRRGVEQLLWRLQHLEVPERIIATIEPFIVRSELSPPKPPPLLESTFQIFMVNRRAPPIHMKAVPDAPRSPCAFRNAAHHRRSLKSRPAPNYPAQVAVTLRRS